jgi:hypothetical protein
MGFFATMAAAAGYKVAQVGVNYTAETAGRHVGYTMLNNTVKNFTTLCSYVPGGRFFGNVIGTSAAGLAVPHAVEQSNKVSQAVKDLGNLGINMIRQYNQPTVDNKIVVLLKNQNNAPKAAPAADLQQVPGDVEQPAANAEMPQEQPLVEQPIVVEQQIEQINQPQQPQVSWGQVAYNVAKVSAPLVVGAGLAAVGVGAFAAPIITNGLLTLPDILKAATEKATSPENLDFVSNIAAPVAIDMAVAAAGTFVGGYVTKAVIDNAYNSRVNQFTNMGAKVDSFLPEKMQGAFKAVGNMVGHVDAGRVAMSPKTIDKAIKSGEATKTIVEAGLGLTAAAVQGQAEGTSTWMKTAAIVTVGITGAAAFAAIAPSAALTTAAIAAVNVTPYLVTYAKGKLFGASAEAPAKGKEEKQQEIQSEKPAEEAQISSSVLKQAEKLNESAVANVINELSLEESISSLDSSRFALYTAEAA